MKFQVICHNGYDQDDNFLGEVDGDDLMMACHNASQTFPYPEHRNNCCFEYIGNIHDGNPVARIYWEDNHAISMLVSASRVN